MAPSQLKQLKAAVHSQRVSKPRSKHDAKPQTKKLHHDARANADTVRRNTILRELHNRHRIGGVVDRRIGEDDPGLTPEQRMLQRYAKQRTKRDVFDLEEGPDNLTHGGRSLFGDKEARDDTFSAVSNGAQSKRGRDDDASEQEPERKKSKKEVMEEVIAKSKSHRYERQKEREDDEEAREELDKELPDLLALLRGPAVPRARTGPTDPSHAAVSKQYDQRIRELAAEQRAQPTDRTKTVEEKAEEAAEKLREQGMAREQRMLGSDEEEDEDNDATRFGFGVHDDEDDFLLDEDLIASDSDFGSVLSESDETESPGELDAELEDGLDLSSSFPCPQTHEELLTLLKDRDPEGLPLLVQQIRALYHSQLNANNKSRLEKFARILVQHLHHLGSCPPSLDTVQALIRHIHSMTRSHANAISLQFRAQLSQMHEAGLALGDLFILTAIGSIYSTSDHFHQVVTPALTIMANWLHSTTPDTRQRATFGAYLVALCLYYGRISRCYVPEAVSFTTAAIQLDNTSEIHTLNLSHMIKLWANTPALLEVFYPAYKILRKHGAESLRHELQTSLVQSVAQRRPLQLHHHRPMAIKTQVPKFEDNFHPDKHYDPDKDRAESNRLRKEHKRERKGALRELRKDAEFMHREQLKEKKQRDAEYERKQRRLIAEIQGTEGHAKNQYEAEKRRRK